MAMMRGSSSLQYPGKFYSAASYFGFEGSNSPTKALTSKFAKSTALLLYSLTETEYVSQMLTLIKCFAQFHGCHVWFVAHPRQFHNWTGGPPNLYDISGSAHFINKCDNGIVIHHNRDLEAGPIDQVQVQRLSLLILCYFTAMHSPIVQLNTVSSIEYMIRDYDEAILKCLV
ncbi:hypothetical protein HN51_016325 [Arachis hypogaea]